MAATIIIKLAVPVRGISSSDAKRRIHPHSFPSRLILHRLSSNKLNTPHSLTQKSNFHIVPCLPPPSPPSTSNTRFNPSTKLFVSGLSFRTTEESLRNAFKTFGQLLEVNLVMDRIANRPKGFAFVRYATEEESRKAIEGMHGKFLDGRVIFVEVAKPRSELPQGLKQRPK